MSYHVSVENYSLRVDSDEALEVLNKLIDNDSLGDFLSDCFNRMAVSHSQDKFDEVSKKLDTLSSKLDQLTKGSVVLQTPVSEPENVATNDEYEEVSEDLSLDLNDCGGLGDLLNGFNQFK